VADDGELLVVGGHTDDLDEFVDDLDAGLGAGDLGVQGELRAKR
jgi:hypothetical protein